ncbi:putative UDP-N-acetylglucosamine [Streptomyces sp. Tu6071]|nr:putative UDP-N-acetylglucosamine [Streptomyces sp. Tu6071]
MREGTQLRGQVLLVEPLVRTRVDVPHEDAGRQLDARVEAALGGAREDLHLDVVRGEAAGQLDDVDVHAARVARPRLVQGRGVHAEHGDAARGPATGTRQAQAARLRGEPSCAGPPAGGGRPEPEPRHVLAHGAVLLAACGRLRGFAVRPRARATSSSA